MEEKIAADAMIEAVLGSQTRNACDWLAKKPDPLSVVNSALDKVVGLAHASNTIDATIAQDRVRSNLVMALGPLGNFLAQVFSSVPPIAAGLLDMFENYCIEKGVKPEVVAKIRILAMSYYWRLGQLRAHIEPVLVDYSIMVKVGDASNALKLVLELSDYRTISITLSREDAEKLARNLMKALRVSGGGPYSEAGDDEEEDIEVDEDEEEQERPLALTDFFQNDKKNDEGRGSGLTIV